jgi:hypothetical protein
METENPRIGRIRNTIARIFNPRDSTLDAYEDFMREYNGLMQDPSVDSNSFFMWDRLSWYEGFRIGSLVGVGSRSLFGESLSVSVVDRVEGINFEVNRGFLGGLKFNRRPLESNFPGQPVGIVEY